MVISYTWTRLHKISANTHTYATDQRTFCNEWKQKIVLQNPKPIPSWCDLFYAVFLAYIPESAELLFTSTGAILVCTENISPQREAFCQKNTTYMKPHVNLPLVTVSWKAGSRLTHVWRVFAVQQKTKWPWPLVNRILTSLQNRVGISAKTLWLEVSLH